jgi:hypothetical protein
LNQLELALYFCWYWGRSSVYPGCLGKHLVYWAKIRWWVEQNYQQFKDELGLDHFEGRSWEGWHHHVTLTMIAFDFLALEGFRAKKILGGPSCAPDGNSNGYSY